MTDAVGTITPLEAKANISEAIVQSQRQAKPGLTT